MESEDIPSYVFDDNINNLHPNLTRALGGITLKVNSNDLEKAKEILNLKDRTKIPEKCPFCYNSSVELNKNNLKSGFLSTILATISISWAAASSNTRSYYRCTSCKEKF
ncbi:MAG: biotin synthase-like enzyme [Flavobacteriales bacterium]